MGAQNNRDRHGTARSSNSGIIQHSSEHNNNPSKHKFHSMYVYNQAKNTHEQR